METVIEVNDLMQKGYRYILTAKEGTNFNPLFKPELSPKQMLSMGIFGGRYMTDCREEFPDDWFEHAKLCSSHHNPEFNFFRVNASQPLRIWRQKGWIYEDDPRGWFQWYCRYYRGRRITKEDERQIKRWRAMKRHISQIKKHCKKGDLSCRKVQRQALLHWAYDSRKI